MVCMKRFETRSARCKRAAWHSILTSKTQLRHLMDAWRRRKLLGNRIVALISTGAALQHPVQRWLVRIFGKMVIDSYLDSFIIISWRFLPLSLCQGMGFFHACEKSHFFFLRGGWRCLTILTPQVWLHRDRWLSQQRLHPCWRGNTSARFAGDGVSYLGSTLSSWRDFGQSGGLGLGLFFLETMECRWDSFGRSWFKGMAGDEWSPLFLHRGRWWAQRAWWSKDHWSMQKSLQTCSRDLCCSRVLLHS